MCDEVTLIENMAYVVYNIPPYTRTFSTLINMPPNLVLPAIPSSSASSLG
jgi:hypothetical protein